MSYAESLLDTLAISTYSVGLDTSDEPHITIDDNRVVQVPEELRRIAVQYDHKVETVTFDCPRYWDGLDMSEMRIYINYKRADKAVGMSIASNVTIDEYDDSIMHFDWTITYGATLTAGTLSFNVCIQKPAEDGSMENHWNSEINSQMTVSPGLEYEEQENPESIALISDLIERMEQTENTVTEAGIYITLEQMNSLLAQFDSIKEELAKRTETVIFTATIEASNWSTGSAPYTNTVTITGVQADDSPHVTPVYSDTQSEAIVQEEAWNMVSYGDALADAITFTCFETCPNIDIPIQVECFRTWKG